MSSAFNQSPGMLSINEFCAWSGLGRTKVYEELGAGRLVAVKAGTKTLIPMDEAEAWRAALPRVSFAGSPKTKTAPRPGPGAVT